MHRPHPIRTPATRLVAAVLLAALSAACRFETVEEENIEASVETTLDRAAEAWGAGDVDGFLSVFADAPATTFIPGDGPAMNREELQSAAGRIADGTNGSLLRFEEVSVRPLPPLIGIVTGRFAVTDARSSTELESGWFTAVVRRVSDGWRIVHAHASWIRD